MNTSFSPLLGRFAKKKHILPLAIGAAFLLFAATYSMRYKPSYSVSAITTGLKARYLPKQHVSPVSDFTLTIPQLHITSPIVMQVSAKESKQYYAALEKGVAHYKGTPFPGTMGNSFIFGHSSSNDKGPYATIFEHLNDLAIGDKVTVTKKGVTYSYAVKTKKIVEPTDLSVLKQTDTEQITLMTCWPPGTIEKRLIIQADRIKDL